MPCPVAQPCIGHIRGSKGWRSGESARLPPMWPGFKSRCRRHTWVEFVVTWDQVLFFSASLLLWLEREKNSAWYIHLTSYQPPPNLHNLTSAWPVMLLANQRLRHGNQILGGIMSLSKSILGKRKFLSTFRWRFLKKIFKRFFFFFAMKYC